MLTERDRSIEELQQEVNSLTAELRDKSILNDRLRESSDRIDRLSVENKALFAQLTELRGKLVELTNEKAEVTDKFQTADAKALRFQKELEKLREVSFCILLAFFPRQGPSNFLLFVPFFFFLALPPGPSP